MNKNSVTLAKAWEQSWENLLKYTHYRDLTLEQLLLAWILLNLEREQIRIKSQKTFLKHSLNKYQTLVKSNKYLVGSEGTRKEGLQLIFLKRKQWSLKKIDEEIKYFN